MAEDNTFGASATNLMNLPGGALSALGGQKNMQAAIDIARALQPQPKPIDPALLSFLFFTQMASEASKPGATALGAASTAAMTPAQYLMKDLERERAYEEKLPTTALNIANMIKPPKGTGVGEKYVKGAPVMVDGKVKRSPEGYPIYKYSITDNAGNVKSTTEMPDLSAAATKNAVTLYNSAGEGKLFVPGSEAYNKAVAGESDFQFTTKPTVTKFTARTVYKDGEEKKVYSQEDYDTATTTGGWSDVKDTSSASVYKSVGKGELAVYMTKEDAEKFVEGMRLPRDNENFDKVVERLTAKTTDQIGQAISQGGVFLEVSPLAKGDEVVTIQFSPSKSAATPFFVTYVNKRLPLIAKSADTYNTTAREVIPRVNEALALLKSGNVETGKLSQALLPFKQVFNQAFGINDPEVMGLETLQATSNFLAPKMRPVGSGSTSDMEFRAYQQAALYLGNTPEANYISLYAFKKMAENGVRLNQLEQELLTSNKYTSMQQVNEKLNESDSGIFEKWTGDPNDEEAILEFYNALPDGAVIINNGIFDSPSPYIIKGWGS